MWKSNSVFARQLVGIDAELSFGQIIEYPWHCECSHAHGCVCVPHTSFNYSFCVFRAPFLSRAAFGDFLSYIGITASTDVLLLHINLIYLSRFLTLFIGLAQSGRPTLFRSFVLSCLSRTRTGEPIYILQSWTIPTNHVIRLCVCVFCFAFFRLSLNSCVWISKVCTWNMDVFSFPQISAGSVGCTWAAYYHFAYNHSLVLRTHSAPH